ncbi:hypothetical protein RBB50_005198 [Rhinocladiella similis]
MIETWLDHFQAWTPRPLVTESVFGAVRPITGKDDVASVRNQWQLQRGVLVTSNAMFCKYADIYVSSATMLVVDEVHHVKNPSKKLAQTIQQHAQKARKIFLTGTPLQNTQVEMAGLLHLVAPGRWPQAEAVFAHGDGSPRKFHGTPAKESRFLR